MQTVRCGYWAWQRDVYASIPQVEAMLPDDCPRGCLNAGLPGYFGRKPVVNLDGLVNLSAVPYWQDGRMDEYLRASGIEIIVDERRSFGRMQRFMQCPPRLETLGRFPLSNWDGDRFVWRCRF